MVEYRKRKKDMQTINCLVLFNNNKNIFMYLSNFTNRSMHKRKINETMPIYIKRQKKKSPYEEKHRCIKNTQHSGREHILTKVNTTIVCTNTISKKREKALYRQ